MSHSRYPFRNIHAAATSVVAITPGTALALIDGVEPVSEHYVDCFQSACVLRGKPRQKPENGLENFMGPKTKRLLALTAIAVVFAVLVAMVPW
ncbi:hypothetical protein [Bordetella muralis]|jgi:hypothetical protein|uniref:hypothetical protein n=1 Tax=Bordetella muralis TaxID=1649130 RepID=UPI0039F0AEEF